MKNVLPCPYCGGEVEVIKLELTEQEKKKKNLPPNPYRISCYQCKALVGRGFKFPDESDENGQLRIPQYEEFVKNESAPFSIQNSAFVGRMYGKRG